jgi:hypothetical protein
MNQTLPRRSKFPFRETVIPVRTDLQSTGTPFRGTSRRGIADADDWRRVEPALGTCPKIEVDHQNRSDRRQWPLSKPRGPHSHAPHEPGARGHTTRHAATPTP